MIDLQEWVGRYLRRQEQQRPGFIVTNDLWNELWNLVIGQGDYNTETLQTLIDEFITEKERTQSMLLTTNIKAGSNVTVTLNADTNDVVISASGGGEGGGGVSLEQVSSMIDNALVEYDTAILDPVRDYLDNQTDGVINTFAQEEDPATNWTTEALQAQHTGDLWFNNDDTKTYIWVGTVWEELAGADLSKAEQLALQGAQIFTTEPVPPYYIGDLYQHDTGRLYYCTTPRTAGLYDDTEWAITTEYLDALMNNTINRVSATEATLLEQSDAITARVTQNTYDAAMLDINNSITALDTRVDTAEFKLETDSIIATVTQSSAYKDIVAEAGSQAETIKAIIADVVAQSTSIEQNAEDITFNFSTLTSNINTVDDKVDFNKETIDAYIKFLDDTITLGKSANDFKAVLSSEELAFMQGTNKVAYIGSNTLFITTAQITDKLTIGKESTALYDILVKNNGNLAIKRRV